MRLQTPVKDVDYFFRFYNKKKDKISTYTLRYIGATAGGLICFLNVGTGAFFNVTKDRASYMLKYNLVKKVAREPEQISMPIPVLTEKPDQNSLEQGDYEKFIDNVLAGLSNIPDSQKARILDRLKIDVDVLYSQFKNERTKTAQESDDEFFGRLVSQYLMVFSA